MRLRIPTVGSAPSGTEHTAPPLGSAQTVGIIFFLRLPAPPSFPPSTPLPASVGRGVPRVAGISAVMEPPAGGGH